MQVAVIGAGVIGLTTAYYLAERGYDVTVIDREPEVASGASSANGGQLSYTFTDALGRPEFLAKIPGLLAGRDPGSIVRIDAALVPWGLRFLAQCTRAKASENTVAVLKAALRSASLLEELCARVPFEFAHRRAGKLVLLSSADDIHGAKASLALKTAHGSDSRLLSPREAVEIEPTLAHLAEDFVGAVYSPSDAVADSRLFAVGLKKWLERTRGVEFLLGCDVEGIEQSNGRLRAINLGDKELAPDAVIVCAGAGGGKLLRPLGINAHVYPMRGYSVTLPTGDAAPSVSFTALRHRMVFSRLDNKVRIAGFADFNGFSTANDATRIKTLLDIAKRYAPQAADYSASEQQPWGGFRPMRPSGQPSIGRTAIDGVYLNIGHGMLGWTLACASGYDLAQCVAHSDETQQDGS
jgi:D-amino-acid dehydrogenase